MVGEQGSRMSSDPTWPYLALPLEIAADQPGDVAVLVLSDVRFY